MYLTLIHLLLVLVGIRCTRGVHIIWDKDAPLDFNEIEHSRAEEVRFPNWLFIYPGTKWCGAGNIAENNNDFGDEARTDKCCRNHDLCDDTIEGYQTGHNLTNDVFYTRLHCKCDEEFFKCLKSIDTRSAVSVGNIYFNGLGTQCFQEEHPITKCNKYVYFPIRKCLRYEVDMAIQKLYQWFDVPIF